MASNVNKAFIGAAVGTLLGALSAVFISTRGETSTNFIGQLRNQTKGFAEKAMHVGEGVLNGVKCLNNSEDPSQFLKGTLLGIAVGAASALFLSPSSGQKLRDELFSAYEEATDQAQKFGKTLRYSHPMKKAFQFGNSLKRKASKEVSKAKKTLNSVKKQSLATRKPTSKKTKPPLKKEHVEV